MILPLLCLRRRLQSTRSQAPPHPSYTPRTNGKAERFIQTAIREWAIAELIRTPEITKTISHLGSTRTTGTDPMASLGLSAAISRSGIDVKNLLTLHG